MKAELMASVQPKLHKLLAMHSTLPLVTRSVALGLSHLYFAQHGFQETVLFLVAL